MRAAVYDTAGPAAGELRIAELPDPEPGPGQVRVRVVVAGVNPTDWKARSGGRERRPWAQQVPGQDGAGIVDRVGVGVDPSRIGQRVWLLLAAQGHAFGTAAEYVCVPARQAVPLPDGVPFDVGAGLGIPMLTAHRCLLADGDVAGRTVLITGGGGAVGHAAIQIARHAGARTITTVRNDDRARIAATALPDVVLDRRAPDHAEQLRASAPDGIDRVVDVDMAAELASYRDLLNGSAVVAAYAVSEGHPVLETPLRPLLFANVVLRLVLIYSVPDRDVDAGIARVTELLTAGELVPLPSIRYPLERIAAAHDHVRTGALGKVLLDIGPA